MTQTSAPAGYRRGRLVWKTSPEQIALLFVSGDVPVPRGASMA
jgi:hypothetical protein